MAAPISVIIPTLDAEAELSACLLGLVEGLDAGCEVIEYSPNEIKLAVAGHGGADKTQMEEMVRTLLKIKTSLEPVDAADALAVALCYSANRRVGAI